MVGIVFNPSVLVEIFLSREFVIPCMSLNGNQTTDTPGDVPLHK